MRIPKNHKRIRNPVAPIDSIYTHPLQPTGGAMEYAPALSRTYPPVPYYGNGIVVGETPMIDTGPQLRSTQTALRGSLSGAGIVSSEVNVDNPLANEQDTQDVVLDDSEAEAEYYD